MRFPAWRCQTEAGMDARPVASAVCRCPSILALAIFTAALLPAWSIVPIDATAADLALPGTDDRLDATHADWLALTDPTLGLTLLYPPDWTVDGVVVATQFSAAARCRSVRVVDFEPPADSGAAAPMQQSLVQVCAQPKEQVGSLDQYMRRVYGESFDRTFALVELQGSRAYEAKGTGSLRTIFAETHNDLVQIVAAIATSPEKFSERQTQVQKILRSLQLK